MRTIALQLLLLAGVSASVSAASVDTVETFSDAMQKNIKSVVITPDSYDAGNAFPVLYLLHGHGGNYADWVRRAPALADYADRYDIIIVCPDGGVNSWYFDSPVDDQVRYETYVSGELVAWVDHHYKTVADRGGRAITGLSMGGHGALYLAFRHQDVFGAAGSMSGGVDIRPFPKNWGLSTRLGAYAEQRENWEKNTVVNMVHLLTPGSLALIIDCGTGDFFYQVNMQLHERLLYRNIPHDFITRPGGHTWEYWNNAIRYQLLYFVDFFSRSQP